MPQLTADVNVLLCEDNGRLSIGAKRQLMLKAASAPWVCMVDDDDLVPEDYCSRVLAIISGANAPDVVGFRLAYFVDGKPKGHAVHSYDSVNLPTPESARRLHRYNRLPNHLNPVRREIALRVGYKSLHSGEDGDYARRMAKLVPRPREVFLDAVMYEYLFVPDKVYDHLRNRPA